MKCWGVTLVMECNPIFVFVLSFLDVISKLIVFYFIINVLQVGLVAVNVIGDRLDTPFDPVDSDSVNKDNTDKFKYIL